MKQYVNPILDIFEPDSMDVLTTSSRLEVVAASEDDVLNYNTIFGITG